MVNYQKGFIATSMSHKDRTAIIFNKSSNLKKTSKVCPKKMTQEVHFIDKPLSELVL